MAYFSVARNKKLYSNNPSRNMFNTPALIGLWKLRLQSSQFAFYRKVFDRKIINYGREMKYMLVGIN